MRDLFRLLTTLTIWGAFTAVVAIMFTSATGPIAQAAGSELVAIVAIMAVIAASMTRSIWKDPEVTLREQDFARGKRKRSDNDRLARLLERLDDDTVRDLEVLLMAQRSDARDAEQR
jgi:hypothetical protein